MSTRMPDSPTLEWNDDWSKAFDHFLANQHPHDDGDFLIDLLSPDDQSLDFDHLTFDLLPPEDEEQLTLDLDSVHRHSATVVEINPNDLIQDGPSADIAPVDLDELSDEDCDLPILNPEDVNRALTALVVTPSDPQSAHDLYEDDKYWTGILEQLRFHSRDLKNGQPTSKLEDNPDFIALLASFEAMERSPVTGESLALGPFRSDLGNVGELKAEPPAMDATPTASTSSRTLPPILERMDILSIPVIAGEDSDEKEMPVLDCYPPTSATSNTKLKPKRSEMKLSTEHQLVADNFRSFIAQDLDLDTEAIHYIGGVLEGVLGHVMEQFKDVFKGKRSCAKVLSVCHIKLPILDQNDNHVVLKATDVQDSQVSSQVTDK